jgi:hypothetical protein
MRGKLAAEFAPVHRPVQDERNDAQQLVRRLGRCGPLVAPGEQEGSRLRRGEGGKGKITQLLVHDVEVLAPVDLRARRKAPVHRHQVEISGDQSEQRDVIDGTLLGAAL